MSANYKQQIKAVQQKKLANKKRTLPLIEKKQALQQTVQELKTRIQILSAFVQDKL